MPLSSAFVSNFALTTLALALGVSAGAGVSGAGTTATYTGFSASVTMGVAPLSVFFDSTGTTSATTSHAWRDCLFGIDSGDTASGNSTYGTRSGLSKRRILGGPTWGHVYETPGTYTATQYVWDGIGYTRRTIDIIVQDPDVVFAGTNTICCSISGTFTGAPSGSSNQTVANLAAAIALLTSGKRVLLQTADAWTTAASGFLNGTKDNMVFGSFGGGRATITITSAQNLLTLNSAGVSRLQVRDLIINGSSLGSRVILGTSALAVNGVHLHNLHAYDIGSLFTVSGTHRTDNFTISKCLLERVKGGGGFVGVFGAATNFLMVDSKIDDATAAEHCLRFQYIGKGYIGGCEFLNPAATKHAMTLRCPNFVTGAGTVGLSPGTYSEYITVSDCIFASNTAQIVTIQPQATTNDERIRRVIMERNYTYALGTTASTGLLFTSFECVSRNNIYNLSAGAANIVGVTTAANNNFVPDSNESWNDTFYSGAIQTTAQGFTGASGSALNSKLKNMLMYTPLIVGAEVIGSTAIATTTGTNNSSNANTNTLDPLFTGPLTGINGFTLGPGSPYATFAALDRNYSDAGDKIRVSNGGAHMLASNATSAWALFGL